jgi:hypothetical protein
MSIVKLEYSFELPEEQEEFITISKATDMKLDIHSFFNELRNLHKYGCNEGVINPKSTKEDVITAIYNDFIEILGEYIK